MTEKVALITGVSRSAGLGLATARALAEQGHRVVVTARNLAQAEEQAATLRAEGHGAEAVRLDLTDTDDFVRVAEHLRTAYGRLDVLVNNASTMPDTDADSALDADPAAVRLALDVDVVGAWALVSAVRDLLTAAPAGRVVNISSGAYQQVAEGADFAGPMMAPAHSFAKYAVNVLTTVLAAAFRGTNVLVSAVDPGRIDTHPEFGPDPEDRPAAESAAWVVHAATLPADAPTGALYLDGERLA